MMLGVGFVVSYVDFVLLLLHYPHHYYDCSRYWKTSGDDERDP